MYLNIALYTFPSPNFTVKPGHEMYLNGVWAGGKADSGALNQDMRCI